MSASTITQPSSTPAAATSEPWLEVLRRKVGGIRFGSVQVIVHEGRVTQIEAIEKTRFAAEKHDHASGARAS